MKLTFTERVPDKLNVEKLIQLLDQYEIEEGTQERFQDMKKWIEVILYKDEIPVEMIDQWDDELEEWLKNSANYACDYNGADESLKHDSLYQYLRSYDITTKFMKVRSNPNPKNFF